MLSAQRILFSIFNIGKWHLSLPILFGYWQCLYPNAIHMLVFMTLLAGNRVCKKALDATDDDLARAVVLYAIGRTLGLGMFWHVRFGLGEMPKNVIAEVRLLLLHVGWDIC
jgi:hypothetical protein